MATKPPALPTVSASLLRRDMQAMLVYIQGARIVGMAREIEISRLQGWLIYRFWAGVLTAALALLLIYLLPINAPVSGLLAGVVLLILAARLGAIISIGRRIKDENIGQGMAGDSIMTLATLGSGKNGVALALLSANAFGLIIYAVFASGLPSTLGLSGGIAPSFVTIEDAALQAKAVLAWELATEKQRIASECETPPPRKQADQASGTQSASTASADRLQQAAVLQGSTATQAGSQVGASGAPQKDTQAIATENRCSDKRAEADKAMAAALNEASPLFKTEQKVGLPLKRDQDWLESVRSGLKLAALSDLFKMLLWAFIAGFFEQLVPDMLDSLATRSRKTKVGGEAATR